MQNELVIKLENQIKNLKVMTKKLSTEEIQQVMTEVTQHINELDELSEEDKTFLIAQMDLLTNN